jgi:hypothetical protein
VKNNLLGFLNVKEEEQNQVLLMLGTGFFIGIFIATYQVTAESLFLNQMSERINQAFLISGALGIASTFIFAALQRTIKFSTLTFVTIILIVLGTTGIYTFYQSQDRQMHDNVLFLMYCLTGPITALLLLSYWGIFGRLFNFKQSKRIIGWIDTGQLIAFIIANFLIPLTSSLIPHTEDYLIICNIAIVGSLVCLILISRNYSLNKNDPSEFDESVKTETTFVKMFQDRYVMLLSLFLVTSMVTYMFNQYAFQTLINKQYPDQRDLTNFIAYFNGAIYALSLLMQTFVNERIISTYGIRVSLFVLPIVTGILAFGSSITGLVFGFSLESGPEAFVFFFLLVALTRLFNVMLRDSLENPVFKLLFIPLDNRYRFNIQSKVEGVISESGRFIAGVIIFAFALIPFFEIIWIPVIVVVLCGIYFLAIGKLYDGYKTKIRSKLENTDFSQDKLELGFAQITLRLEDRLLATNEARAIFSFKLLEKINPSKVGQWVNNLMRNTSDEATDYAQRRMNEIKGLSVSEKYVIKIHKDSDGTGKNVLTKNDLELILNSGGEITKARIQKLCRSLDISDRQYAAELLLHSASEENISFLIELLHDPEIKVRRTAITTAIKRNNNEVIYSLIDNLNNSLFSNQAMNSLILIGGKALVQLDGAFYRSGQNTQTMIRIIQIIGRVGGQKAKDLLWNKIDYPDKVIVSQVLLSLGECGFKAGISQITRIKYAIESDIGDITWNLGALQELADNERTVEVREAILREIQNDTDHIYMLLAMLYDTRSIQLVKENIESGTSEGITYAVELLDVFLSEQLKVKVIPVIDDLSINEKISRLEVFYPRVKLDEKLVLKFLINRDFTQSNRWTKSCVIQLIGNLKITDFKLDLIAQLFNPDRLIREISAWSLYQIDPDLYHSNAERLGEDVKRWLDRAIVPGNSSKLMLFEKVLFYKRIEIFENIPGISLSFIADISRELRLKKDEQISIDEKLNNDFFIVYSGSARYYSKGNHQNDFIAGQFIGEVLAPVGFVNSNLLVANADTILLRVNKDQFYELLADNVKLADRVLEYI